MQEAEHAPGLEVTIDNETAVERIIDALRVKLMDSVPQITGAAHASGQPSSTTLKVSLKPAKDHADVWTLELTEKLALASMPIDATARITSTGKRGPQLSLMAFFDEVSE